MGNSMGRVAILHLLPLSLEELMRADINKKLDAILYEGCYPRIHADQLNPTKTYASYVRTYIERDIRMILQVHNLSLFQKFIILLASRVGQILNKESLSVEVGISSKTVEHWLSILEACYIVYRLSPYFENFGKRVVNLPKFIFAMWVWLLIPFPENNVIFERVKASGFNDRKWVHIIDIDPFAIVESRELSRSSNMTLFPGNGIIYWESKQLNK